MEPALTKPTISARIHSVQVGPVAPLGPRGVPSGFVKHVVEGSIRAGMLGLEGDEQADLTVHGGPEKAIYGYALSNYPIWLRDFPRHESLLTPGGFGENLTIGELDESIVCIGDIVSVGTATLQISQPRQPCFKLALRFNDKHLLRAMTRNGLCGWYYRVLKPGTLSFGDVINLQARPNPDWSIARFHRFIAARMESQGDMAELAKLEGLAAHWRQAALQAVSNR